MRTSIVAILAWIANTISAQEENRKEKIQDIKCMNFYGLETERKAFVCDWLHPPEWYITTLISDMGINTLRIPFSYEYYIYNNLYHLDDIMFIAEKHGLRVILDYHRTWATHQGPTPEEGISMTQFLDLWISILDRFQHYNSLFGVGVFNEIQTSDLAYTVNMHRYIITAIEDRFPGRFHFFAGCPQWGGNCSGIDLSDMPTWDRTYIEVHKYQFSGSSTPEDWEVSIPRTIPADHWFIGETGWKHDITIEREWATGFIEYLKSRNINNVCGWTIAHSHDTDGWWHDDCDTFNHNKADLFNNIWIEALPPLTRLLRGGHEVLPPTIKMVPAYMPSWSSEYQPVHIHSPVSATVSTTSDMYDVP